MHIATFTFSGSVVCPIKGIRDHGLHPVLTRQIACDSGKPADESGRSRPSFVPVCRRQRIDESANANSAASEIMLGGRCAKPDNAKPDSAIPRQSSVCGGRKKVQRTKAADNMNNRVLFEMCKSELRIDCPAAFD